MEAPPIALTIAGSDNSAGAGIQADLKTFTHFRVYGLTTVTCVVAEVPGYVAAIEPVTAELVREQLKLSFARFPVAALKTGMLYSREIIETVCGELERIPLTARPWIVVDPVMVASSGDPLLSPEALESYQQCLFGLADVITPNLDEASALLGEKIESLEQLEEAGRRLSSRYETAFVVKGGHLKGTTAYDFFVEGDRSIWLEAPYVADISTHGTGCSFSAALASGLALGDDLASAVQRAKRYTTAAIAQSFRLSSASSTTELLRHWPT